MYRILIIEDDDSLCDLTKSYFEKKGFFVSTAGTVKKGISLLKTIELDCAIVDIQLPDGSGFDLCEEIKGYKNIPIIFVSNHTEEECRVSSFLSGGDDFLAKPFSLKELELRIHARIRQFEDAVLPEETLHYPPITIHKSNRCVNCEDYQVGFTAAEFNVLYFLATHPEKVYSTEQIYDQVWKQPNLGDAHTVQVHITNVRKKMNALREGHNYIETIWGKGYQFMP